MRQFIAVIFTFILGLATTVSAQTESTGKLDAVFPEAGKSSVTVWTGIPYIGIVEYAYGVTDNFSIGLIAGLTPTTKAAGIRLRGIIAQPSERFRLYVKSPILYYPGSADSHSEPWLLAWPTLNAELCTTNDLRLWAGLGLIGAGCAHHLLGVEDEAMDKGGPGFRGGIWNTVSAGISKPLNDRIEWHAEVGVVMKGLRTANDASLGGKKTDLYWDGGLPLILDVGISYAF